MNQKNNPPAFTSYAQNFEDVMLWRALKHVPVGTYVDIGAQHPTVDSVSKAFHEQGWRGVHVEPVPYYAELLRQDRPDEVVLQLALSDSAGILELHVIAGTGLSTGVPSYAENLQTRHGFSNEIVRVPTLPMRTALASLEGKEVHWLKVDVEGFEEKVLEGWNSETLRPWIVVIEATVPMSTELRFDGADAILVKAGYEFVYFDGLNRFYVASEHKELRAAFEAPPNVFDGARLSGLSSSAWCAGVNAAHAGELEAARADAREAGERLAAERDRSNHALIRLQAVEARASNAEMLLKHALDRAIQAEARAQLAGDRPLRRLANAVAEGRILSGIKRRIKTALRIAAIATNRSPGLKRAAGWVLACVPPLRRRLRATLAPPDIQRPADPGGGPSPMSPDTALTFRQLKQGQPPSETHQ
ncbi:FkbM family methyltransferase [Variovorax sp. Varisp41]|uniref:FkbM family methyltransferase n=1 Tax=unclassified Variovorax TaxID=663243 RepID=UPI0039B470C4